MTDRKAGTLKFQVRSKRRKGKWGKWHDEITPPPKFLKAFYDTYENGAHLRSDFIMTVKNEFRKVQWKVAY